VQNAEIINLIAFLLFVDKLVNILNKRLISNYFLGGMRIEKIIYFLVCGNKNEAGKTMITPHLGIALWGFTSPVSWHNIEKMTFNF